ncbi:4-hydroxyphenylacetate 3-hydroxylase family protein [Marinibaculum pumilum]|uniref:4-hydroxyphenylacetate 3-hydroxylase family protein n=1 Tax=Marinibaculum pumilum TaxID=1766165 RepID=A0ABV7L8P9_9PROT
MLRDGATHIASLNDGRAVFIDGRRVADVTTDRAFRNAVATSGRLYDFVADPENAALMTYDSGGGNRCNRIWEQPADQEGLVRRRLAMERWQELHCGFLGRSPDHVASCISGMAMGIEVFREHDPARADALEGYYRHARDNDLFLTYVIINPQADRSKAAHEQSGEHFTAGVVDQDGTGLTVRGAKMLATSAIMANEVFVTCIQPLAPGDAAHALSFAIPMNAKGLKVLSRKSYEGEAGSVFDNPLASRFDENDAVLYFDDVKVPWDRVFVNQDVAMCQKQFHATPAHVYQNYQAQVRLMVKMRFLVGLGRRIAEVNGTTAFPQVREALGQLAAQAAMVEGMVHAMEAKGRRHGHFFVPDRHSLYAAQVLTQQLYPQVVTALRDLAGGGLIMLPSGIADFADPELAALIERTQQSPATDSRGRVKFFKLAWDALGSEFASRHTQYEMFYAGASFVTKNHSFRTYDWERSAAMVDGMLDSYSLDEEITRRAAE